MVKIQPKEYKKVSFKIEMIATYGFLFYKVEAGAKAHKNHFSPVFDPIKEIRSWLEAICVGVEKCSFSVDNEGRHAAFDYINCYGGLCRVTFSGTNDELFAIAATYQLIEEMYTSIKALSSNPDIIYWEKDSQYKITEFTSPLIEKYLADKKKLLTNKSQSHEHE